MSSYAIIAAMRPQMPTEADQARSDHTADRLAVLEERHEEIAREWMENVIPDEVLESWGPPDLSVNALVEQAEGLSTPGLYGATPRIDNAGGVEELSQLLDEMATWQLAQRVEYLARGMGECCVRLEWLDNGTMAERLVMPHNVWVRTDPNDPMKALVLGELQMRPKPNSTKGEQIYTWEVFDISNPANPTFKIYEAGKMGEMGEDLTQTYLPDFEGYPWRWNDDTPFIPVVTYHEAWTGTFWNPNIKRGVYWGTLNQIMFSTFTAHSAHAASGSVIIVSGLDPIASGVDRTTDSGKPIKSIVLQPGTLLYHDQSGEGQPMVTEVGPGSNLKQLAEFSQGYSAQMLIRSGLSAPDATRASASPTSGAALYITNKQKREASKRLEPSFRRSDMELIQKVAQMRNIQTGSAIPVDGYSITYEHPPESPQEESDRRDDIDWKVSKGMMSPIDAYRELHPGVTREAALRALVQAQTDVQQIEDAAQEVLTGGTAEKAADTALNGAQVTAAQGIVESVALGNLPRSTGVSMLVTFFNIPNAVAENLMGDVGRGFEPTGDQEQAPPPSSEPEPEPIPEGE